MASFSISSSLHITCSFSKQQLWRAKNRRHSVRTNQATSSHVVTRQSRGREGQEGNLHVAGKSATNSRSKHGEEVKLPQEGGEGGGSSSAAAPKFRDERWNEGTWDLNMFVSNGRMDWDGLIVAEATRRRFLELHPEASTKEEPVVFRSSIIPWWAWIRRSHLPEAELLNGRAAMIGFFMAYSVDALTGLGIVGQTGNFLCKAGLLVTILGVMLFRRSRDLETLRKLAGEATYYDKQWQASWESYDDQSAR